MSRTVSDSDFPYILTELSDVPEGAAFLLSFLYLKYSFLRKATFVCILPHSLWTLISSLSSLQDCCVGKQLNCILSSQIYWRMTRWKVFLNFFHVVFCVWSVEGNVFLRSKKTEPEVRKTCLNFEVEMNIAEDLCQTCFDG